MTWLQLIFEAPNAMRLRSQNKYLRKYEIFIQKRKQNIFFTISCSNSFRNLCVFEELDIFTERQTE